MCYDSPLHSFRIVKINYGWGREKDRESWKAVLKKIEFFK